MSDAPNQIQRFEGVPRKTGRRGERTLWRKFLAFISGKLNQSDELATEYATAYVNEKQAEAQIKANEAAKIAEEVALEKSKTTKAVFSLIDEAMSFDQDMAQELKVRQLLQDYPHLADQMRLIAQRGNDLAKKYGTRVDVRAASEHVSTERQLQLPPAQDETT